MAKRPAPSSRRPRRALSREVVVAAALRLVDDIGLDDFSMRRLGGALDIDPMAVYRHVSSKAQLLDAVVEAVMAEVVIPAGSGPWQDRARALAQSLRSTLLRHPNAIVLVGSRPARTPEASRPVEAGLAIFRDAGFSLQDASDAIDCLGRMVIGHALAEVGVSSGADAGGDAEAHVAAAEELPPGSFPHLTAAARAGVARDHQAVFELGLEGILLALAARRPRRSRAKKSTA